MGTLRKVAILDCIGFDLSRANGGMQVRFAKCLLHDDGRIERQYANDKLLCHRHTFHPDDDIDAIMIEVCAYIEGLGYDAPTQQMVERIKAHCAAEWGIVTIDTKALSHHPMMPFSVNTDLVQEGAPL